MNHCFTASNSQIVRKVWYNPDTRILSVQLADKNTKKHLTKKDRPQGYLYVGVPQPVFDQFARAKSKGKFFVHNIKPHYPAQLDVFCAANSIG